MTRFTKQIQMTLITFFNRRWFDTW